MFFDAQTIQMNLRRIKPIPHGSGFFEKKKWISSFVMNTKQFIFMNDCAQLHAHLWLINAFILHRQGFYRVTNILLMIHRNTSSFVAHWNWIMNHEFPWIPLLFTKTQNVHRFMNLIMKNKLLAAMIHKLPE